MASTTRMSLHVSLLATLVVTLTGCLSTSDTDIPLSKSDQDAGADTDRDVPTNPDATHHDTTPNPDAEPDGCVAPTTWYADGDLDSFGDEDTTLETCEQPEGYIAVAGDCDDTNDAINPDGDEVCDGVDNDCDGDIDEEPSDGVIYYADHDGDGVGREDSTLVACAVPGGYAADPGDCNDLDPATYPGADEICGDGTDNDCDTEIDEDGCQVAPAGTCDDALVLPEGGGMVSGPDISDGSPFLGECELVDTDTARFVRFEVTQPSQVVHFVNPSEEFGTYISLWKGPCDSLEHVSCFFPSPVGLAMPLDQGSYLVAIVAVASPAWKLGVALEDSTTGECLVPDLDGDGVTICEQDCNEDDPGIFWGQRETCNGVDDDCTMVEDDLAAPCETGLLGACGAGIATCQQGQEVCSAIVQDGIELCGDGLDNDCDGDTDEGDCADRDEGETCGNPTQIELGEWISDNLDGAVADHDVACAGPGAGDHVYAFDVPSGGGSVWVDSTRSDSGQVDNVYSLRRSTCDTTDASRCFPQGRTADDQLPAGTHYLVVAGRGDAHFRVGFQVTPMGECGLADSDGDGQTVCDGDCDDSDPSAYDGATEICDGIDNNCNWNIDDVRGSCTTDLLGVCVDGAAHCVDGVEVCESVVTAGAEVCSDTLDNDCNGEIDEAPCAVAAPGDYCTNAIPIETDEWVEGDLSTAPVGSPWCTMPMPSRVYRLDIEEDRVELTLQSEATAGDVFFEVFDTGCDLGFPMNCGSSLLRSWPRRGPVFVRLYGDGGYRFRAVTRTDHGVCSISDSDGDGATICDGDCDDTNPDVQPDAVDVCDSVDNNCNGQIDEGSGPCMTSGSGNCATGVLSCAAGVETCTAVITAGAEVCNDQQDNDCDGSTDEADCTNLTPGETCANVIVIEDGVTYAGNLDDATADLERISCLGVPQAETIYELQIDGVEGQQFTISGQQGEGADVGMELRRGACDDAGRGSCYGLYARSWFYEQPGTFFLVVYGDGEYSFTVARQDPTTYECSVPDGDGDGATLCDGDCNDADPAIGPEAEEICDGLDNNCDGQIDEVGGPCLTGQPGACARGLRTCVAGLEVCDPTIPTEALEEICSDGQDNDCNGQTDEIGCTQGPAGETCGDAIDATAGGAFSGNLTGYAADGQVLTCDASPNDDVYYRIDLTAGMLIEVTSNMPSDAPVWATVFPDRCEGDTYYSCNQLRNLPPFWLGPGTHFLRLHGAGPYSFSLALRNSSSGWCSIGDGDGDGFTICDDDCDDTDPTTFPGAEEICDGADNDCNGQTDEMPPSPCDIEPFVDPGVLVCIAAEPVCVATGEVTLCDEGSASSEDDCGVPGDEDVSYWFDADTGSKVLPLDPDADLSKGDWNGDCCSWNVHGGATMVVTDIPLADFDTVVCGPNDGYTYSTDTIEYDGLDANVLCLRTASGAYFKLQPIDGCCPRYTLQWAKTDG